MTYQFDGGRRERFPGNASENPYYQEKLFDILS